MILDILLLFVPILFGCIAGVITGLIAGIHTNTLSAIIVAIYFIPGFLEIDPLYLILFISSMAISNTFFDVFPSLFLGIPSSEVYALLPGHKMVKNGRGYEALTVSISGSFFGFFISLMICLGVIILDFILDINIMKNVYSITNEYIFYILLAIIFLLIITDKNIIWAFIMVVFSGIFGVIALGSPIVPHPDSAFNTIFPALIGLFALPGLLMSLFEKNDTIPNQIINDTNKLAFKKNSFLGSIGGMLTGLLPGVGSANAATCLLLFQNLFTKNKEDSNFNQKKYLATTSAIGSSDALFAIIALYFIDRSRSGASVAIEQINADITISIVLAIFGSMAISSSISFFIVHSLKIYVIKIFNIIDYKPLSLSVITYLLLITLMTTGLGGIFILFIGLILGLIPYFTNIRKAQAMGFFLVPVLLFFSQHQSDIVTKLFLEAKYSNVSVFSLDNFLIGGLLSLSIPIIIYLVVRKFIREQKNSVKILYKTVEKGKNYSGIVIFTTILGIILLIISLFMPDKIKSGIFIFDEVYDGDTISFYNNFGKIKCRIEGIDTPEKYDSKKINDFSNKYNIPIVDIKSSGEIATQYAIDFFSKSKEYFISISGKDVYNRHLCIVYSKDKKINYNLEIVKDGYAISYKDGKYISSEKIKLEIMQAEYNARINKLGLWDSHYIIMNKMKE